MVEISEKEVENYTPFHFGGESEYSKKSRMGPKYFCKIDKGDGWSKIRYFT